MIKETTEYNKFKPHQKQRRLKELRVLMIIKDFNKWYHDMPILVNKDFEIVNGQHRLEACRRLNVPVRYMRT